VALVGPRSAYQTIEAMLSVGLEPVANGVWGILLEAYTGDFILLGSDELDIVFERAGEGPVDDRANDALLE
jgi:hypothetical protein